MPTVTDPSAAIASLTTVIQKAASNPAYRKALITSTKATLESAGITIPAGLEVKVVENSDKIRNMVTIAKSSLTSDDLQQLKTMVSSASVPKTAIESYAKLLVDSLTDPAVEKQLATDAKAALTKYGISIPSGVSINQLASSGATGYLAIPSGSTGEVANVTSSLNVTKLITAGSYVAGLGFAIGSIFKFKQHKDNPTQIPIGTPIALVLVSAAELFLPSLATSS